MSYEQIIPAKQQIHVAVIGHKHGSDVYLGDTAKALDRQLADFAKEYWEYEGVKGDPSGLSDSDVVDKYFNKTRLSCESLDTMVAQVVSLAGATRIFEIEKFKFNNNGHGDSSIMAIIAAMNDEIKELESGDTPVSVGRKIHYGIIQHRDGALDVLLSDTPEGVMKQVANLARSEYPSLGFADNPYADDLSDDEVIDQYFNADTDGYESYIIDFTDVKSIEMADDDNRQIVFTGIVQHGCGFNSYASDTKEGVVRQIADFARYWYVGMCDDGADPQNLSDQDVIDNYFGDSKNTESYEINRVPVIPIPKIPAGSCRDKDAGQKPAEGHAATPEPA